MPWARCHQLSRRPSIVISRFHRQNLFPIGPVAILNPQRNRRPDRLPVAHARKNLRSVLFDLLPPTASIAKLPPPQLVIDELHINRQLRGQPGDKRQQRLPVRFPRGVKTKHPRSFLARICAHSIQIKRNANSVAAVAPPVQRTLKLLRLMLIEKGLASHPDAETKGMLEINKALVLNLQGDHTGTVRMLRELALDPKSTLGRENSAKAALSILVMK